jgi:hypothetical protein
MSDSIAATLLPKVLRAVDELRPELLEPEPPFPADAFPPTIAKWLESVATRAVVPTAFIAAPFLALTGATIGRQLALAVGPGWIERPTLWVALIARTGSGKTPAIAAARAPFTLNQHVAWERWIADHRDGETPRPARPHLDRLVVSTPHARTLASALTHSPGLALLRDELHGLINAIDRRNGEDRQHLLSTWSTEPLLLPNPADGWYIPAPVVAIIGGIQPALVKRMRVGDQDGFLERFLFVYPDIGDPLPPPSRLAAAPTDAEIAAIVAPLRSIDTSPLGLEISMARDARNAWTNWYRENSDHISSASPVLAAFYRKRPIQLARIALILHALWQAESAPTAPFDVATPLTLDTLNRAIALMEWFRVQIHRAITLIGERYPVYPGSTSFLFRILKVLAATDVPDGWISRNQLNRDIGRPPKILLDRYLDMYVTKGVVEYRTVGTAGRSRSEYRIARADPSNRDEMDESPDANALYSALFGT